MSRFFTRDWVLFPALLCSSLYAALGAAQESPASLESRPTSELRPVISDARIEGAIEGELWEARAVDANDVRVSVEDGVATLSGAVDSWNEWRKAAENAREGGAYRVRNKLGLGE